MNRAAKMKTPPYSDLAVELATNRKGLRLRADQDRGGGRGPDGVSWKMCRNDRQTLQRAVADWFRYRSQRNMLATWRVNTKQFKRLNDDQRIRYP